MYRQILVPNEQNNSISIPRKWYGTEVEVLVFPVKEKPKRQTVKKKEQPEIDYTDMNQVLAHTDKKDVEKIEKIFSKYLIPLNDFKFDRDEANNYD